MAKTQRRMDKRTPLTGRASKRPVPESRRAKKPSSKADLKALEHWSTPRGQELHDYCAKNMPPGAIRADLSKQAPNNSYGPPMWYVDQNLSCRDCGEDFLWSAKKQQHWFEVLKLPIYKLAVRCPNCARKHREAEHARREAQKQRMAEMAKRPRHPNEAFFKRRARPARARS